MHDATVSVDLEDARTVATVQAALAVELEEGAPGTRTTIEAGDGGADLILHVAAEDLSGLRAALNNAVRLVDAARRTVA